jgi:hypothetical protein
MVAKFKYSHVDVIGAAPHDIVGADVAFVVGAIGICRIVRHIFL